MSEQSERGAEGADASSRRTFLRTGGLMAAGGVAAAAATAAMVPTPAGAGLNGPLVPVYLPAIIQRIYDSRSGPKIQPNQQRHLVPLGGDLAGFIAIAVNLTVTQTVAAGYLAAFPGDEGWAGTSSINWFTSNEDVANNALIGLPLDGSFNVRCGGQGPTHFVIDLIGVTLFWDTAETTTVEDATARYRERIQQLTNLGPWVEG